MASLSARPHRQARSGVSYRDPYYDYEDDFSFCRRKRSDPSATTLKRSKDSQRAAKKNLASRHTQNRANAKERAEAGQLQRAINESLSQQANVHLQRGVHESLPYTSADVAPLVLNHEKSMVDEHGHKILSDNNRVSMDCVDKTACNDCVAFQCLLDAATEAVLENNIYTGEPQDMREGPFGKQNEEDGQGLESAAEIIYNGEIIEPSVRTFHGGELTYKSTSDESNNKLDNHKHYLQDKTKDQINTYDEGDGNSSDDWEEGSSEQVYPEDENSGLSDETGCQRRRPVKAQQKARKAAVKDNVFPVEVKNARRARSLFKLEASCTENRQTSVSTLSKLSMKAPGGKENILTCSSKESTKNTASVLKQQIVATENDVIKKNYQSVERFQSWEANEAQVFDIVSAGQQGILRLPLQRPAIYHRRVIGLSRRYRPPPLHPYLPKRER